MTKIETLLIIHKHPKILLAMKKKKFGIGKYNGFGGKVEKGETITQAAIRETFEEGNINVINPKKIGEILFKFEEGEEDHLVHFFKAEDYNGELKETEEMKPQWFNIEEIPYDKMWEDDKHWLPLLLENKKFIGNFNFNKEGKISDYKLNQVSSLN
jgi:ADP-ribose pyrophosphatase YjhB (NUDIX family)